MIETYFWVQLLTNSLLGVHGVSVYNVHYNAFDSFNYNEEEIEIYKHFKAISNNIVLSYKDPSADLKYFESVSL